MSEHLASVDCPVNSSEMARMHVLVELDSDIGKKANTRALLLPCVLSVLALSPEIKSDG
jgi:hypothetical protein